MSPENPEPARLLVVDDLEVNRDLLARRVRRLGHEAGFAENGVAALAQLRASAWDLVLLDITMPEMDGYETLRQIKADAALSDIPVIMVSAIDETDSVVRCLELGADDYLTKPFNPVVLQARIESSLAKKRLVAQQQATLRALSREMEIGRRIQQGFLPEALPRLTGWQLAAMCTPARQVGGDFYDALVLPGGRLAFAIADICDKGVGAALYMTLFRTLLRTMLVQAPAAESASQTLTRVIAFINDYIAVEHGRDNMFATMFVAIVDPATGNLDYHNAGHDAPMLWRRASGQVDRLPPQGPAVGLMPGIEPVVMSCALGPGDRLLAYTDGVTEAIGDAGPLGEPEVQELLAISHPDAAWLVDAVGARVSAHAQGRHPHDDITLLCLMREG
jgi:phosphoserine phosphatase RsbU/P